MAELGTLKSDDMIRITRHFRMQWEEAQQAHVLLYPEGMVTLNAPAAEILTRCREAKSVTQVVEELQQAFPQDDIAADVREFLEDAYGNGWICIERPDE
jgi:pyrroloquinoline quinone biosynthesis protein D